MECAVEVYDYFHTGVVKQFRSNEGAHIGGMKKPYRRGRFFQSLIMRYQNGKYPGGVITVDDDRCRRHLVVGELLADIGASLAKSIEILAFILDE